MPLSPSTSAVAGLRSITLMFALGLKMPDSELLDVAGEPENAVRIRAREIGVEHRIGDDLGVGVRQPAGAERVGHVRENGGGLGRGGHCRRQEAWSNSKHR